MSTELINPAFSKISEVELKLEEFVPIVQALISNSMLGQFTVLYTNRVPYYNVVGD